MLSSRKRPVAPLIAGCLATFTASSKADEVESTAHAPYVQFESGAVTPLVLSADGRRLMVLNTPDHRLEVYATFGASGQGGATTGRGQQMSNAGESLQLRYLGSVLTGLDPVAIALHPDDPSTAFVANAVSDTVAVVDLDALEVVATIPVGDEPNDLAVVDGKVFVACSRAPVTPATPGQIVPDEFVDNVVVAFAAEFPYHRTGLIEIPALRPRCLVADGNTVFVIPQNSGNHTTLLNEDHAAELGLRQWVSDGFDGDFDVNPVLLRSELNESGLERGWAIPWTGRIVFDWEHPGRTPVLADLDVLAIDATSQTLNPGGVSGVGTTLLGGDRNPTDGRLWIVGTDADNRTRFEPKLRGVALDNRVTVVDPTLGVEHVYALTPPRLPRDHAQPVAIAFDHDELEPRAYIACLGTDVVVVLDAGDGTYVAEIDQLPQPLGLTIDPDREVLYVLCRGDLSVRAFDLAPPTPMALGEVRPLAYNPEPPAVVRGRAHLYSAARSDSDSSGTMSCASCHVFGHGDQLAWDLGDPAGSLAYFYPDLLREVGGFEGELVVAPTSPLVNPWKGPMVTQSLRGLHSLDQAEDLPLHWRGDRRTFHQFEGAFEHLLDRRGVDREQVQELASFLRSVVYPPNPFQPEDRVYRGLEANGADKYGMNPQFEGKEIRADTGLFCVTCHKGDFFDQTNFTGARHTTSAGAFQQMFNTAQLRLAYEKDFRDLAGFGLLHDGRVDGVAGFMDFVRPRDGTPVFPNFDATDKEEVAAFVRQWDTGMAPLVGSQFTLSLATLHQANAFFDVAEARARAGDLDLILKGSRLGAGGRALPRGAHYRQFGGEWAYQFDTGDAADRATVIAVVQAGLGRFTATAVPPQLGGRLGIDQDEDGLFDRREFLLSTDPRHPDTDRDGVADGHEVELGTDPRVADSAFPDVDPPVIERLTVSEVFADVATVVAAISEAATLHVAVGSTPGSDDVADLSLLQRRRSHEAITLHLPAGTTLYVTATATDATGNTGTASTTFTTLPPMLHVEAIELEKSGDGPYVVAARVLVGDHTGRAIAGVPIQGFWSGDLGGQQWQQKATTGADGWATFALNEFTPAGPTTVAFTVAYLGSTIEGEPFFVGYGGSTPGHYYDQTANRAHYAKVDLP